MAEDSGSHEVSKDFVLPQDLQTVAGEPAPTVTLNTQINSVDASLHLHQAMLLPDPDAAERLEVIHPGFMQEVMEARRREQRARLLRESRAQQIDAKLSELRLRQVHEGAMKANDNEHQRFNGAIAIMGFIGLIFGVVGAITLLKGMYWPAGGMGTAMAFCFSRVVKLLQVSKQRG